MLSEAPTLMYGDNYYSSATYYPEWGWQLYLPFPSFLLPNQTVNGYLKYEITKGTQPKQLLFLDEDSPRITIDFS